MSGWHVYNGMRDQAATTGYLTTDGLAEVSAADPDTAAPNVIDVGARNGANFFAGDIGEVLLYLTPHTAGQRAQVQAYLKSRWGTP